MTLPVVGMCYRVIVSVWLKLILYGWYVVDDPIIWLLLLLNCVLIDQSSTSIRVLLCWFFVFLHLFLCIHSIRCIHITHTAHTVNFLLYTWLLLLNIAPSSGFGCYLSNPLMWTTNILTELTSTAGSRTGLWRYRATWRWLERKVGVFSTFFCFVCECLFFVSL